MVRFVAFMCFLFVFWFGIGGAHAGGMVSYRDVCRIIKPPSGWEVVEKCNGIDMRGSQFSWIMANEALKKGNDRVEINVISGMKVAVQWASMGNMNYVGNEEGYMKKIRIGRYEGIIIYNNKDKSGDLAVCIKKQDNVCFAVFAINFSSHKPSWVISLAESFDIDALADLFKNVKFSIPSTGTGGAPPYGMGVPPVVPSN